MVNTASPDQVRLIVDNLHRNPFEVLGAHRLDEEDSEATQADSSGTGSWVIRAYLPDAEAAWVTYPERSQEFPMTAVHHPHFFECLLPADVQDVTYQIRVQEGGCDRTMYDPYAFASPLLTDFDIHLFAEGNHHRIYEKLGAHLTSVNGVDGVYFAVWAPNARNVSVVGVFNNWDGRRHQMRMIGNGIWDLFIPDLTVGEIYKYEIKNQHGHIYNKADPYGFQHEVRPDTASIVADLSTHTWNDATWLERRQRAHIHEEPISVYEVHLGSWMHESMDHPPAVGAAIGLDEKPEARFLTYREFADRLIPYVKDMGYTHIEVLPVTEYPYDGSWGYQVTGYYAPTARYGSPTDFMYFVDQCHQHGIGVIVDWVPGHFPKDAHGLAYFDGSHLYEHEDPRKGEHKEWGTLVFNYARHEVRNFLIASALFWFEVYHIDGIRVDAVASMLYLDYDREPGQWIPNYYGGHEHLEAVDFLKQLNTTIFEYYPGALSIAEESTSWANVSRPVSEGGLGFNLKWNMGWMNDTLRYFHEQHEHRQHHHGMITFSIWYAFNENFVLALSHDEVVHGKGSLFQKMPGNDDWQKFANLRTLFAYMFTHPGKKTMFMGMEFGQTIEWNVWRDLDWSVLKYRPFQQLQQFIKDLNQLYQSESALYTQDFTHEGFEWVELHDAGRSVLAYRRKAKDTGDNLTIVCNFTPQVHHHYPIGVREAVPYVEILNSDDLKYGGSGIVNAGELQPKAWHSNVFPHVLDVLVPPLSVIILKPVH